MSLQHQNLGLALSQIYPADSLAQSSDPWVVALEQDVPTLVHWPSRLGPEPTLGQVETALTNYQARKQVEEMERQQSVAWARNVFNRWATLTDAERLEVLRRVFQRLFSQELNGGV